MKANDYHNERYNEIRSTILYWNGNLSELVVDIPGHVGYRTGMNL